MNAEVRQRQNTRRYNRHVFSRYRTHIRWGASAVYLFFGVFDYIYSKEKLVEWLLLRLSFVILVFGVFEIARRYKFVRNRMDTIAMVTLVAANWPVCWMIMQSGAHLSLYSTGLIICATTGVQIFRMRRKLALKALTLSFAPAIWIYAYHGYLQSSPEAIIQIGFLLGMIILGTIYGHSEEKVEDLWNRFKTLAKIELEGMRKTEALKAHFPKVLQEQFSKNPSLILQKKILPNAVVGFADIVGSSRISNEVPLIIDWEIKERFLEAATLRAIQSDMVVLTHLGDGFLFLANYNESSQWYYNIISFYESLVADFNRIARELNLSHLKFETGVKFGVSSGPVVVGFLGKGQSYFTAIGPDVNLAARLCSLADVNQIVLSSRVWHSIKPLLLGWDFKTTIHSDIKGFDYPISAVHVSPRSVSENSLKCSQCAGSMSLVKTEDGFLDYQCAEGHNTPKLGRDLSTAA